MSFYCNDKCRLYRLLCSSSVDFLPDTRELLLPSAALEDFLWRKSSRHMIFRVSQWRASTEHSLSQSEPVVYLKVLNRGTFEIKQAVARRRCSGSRTSLLYTRRWSLFYMSLPFHNIEAAFKRSYNENPSRCNVELIFM